MSPVSAQQNTLPEIGGDGLQGYIDTWFNTNTQYQMGASFYATAWPLVKSPLANYQVGLPSTWFIPNNDLFTQPLCPQGTVARNWPDRGPTWNTVFQTMEGGLGNWVDIQFPTATPKYRIGGTNSCYSFGASAPGFGWGTDYVSTTALPANKMGTAQLSNGIVVPPDGLTLHPDTNGQQLGIAYMPIPLTFNQTSPQPTGDHSWTLFLNAQNFSGPVAFNIPNYWSSLSQTYSVIAGRGFDALPAYMDSAAMEVNTVPYFSSQDSSGTTYTRIPALQFPVDSNGQTILTQGVQFYSADAFYTPVKNALANNQTVPAKFPTGGNMSMSPKCSLDPLSFTQGSNNTPITGLNNIVQTHATEQNGQCTFGLQWSKVTKTGLFPEYYKQQGSNLVPVDVSSVPADTQLQTQTFQPAATGKPYVTPTNLASNRYWNHWVKTQPAVKVTLADGSILTYRWYKFINQPAIKGLGLTAQEATNLQNNIEALHKSWANQKDFMPPPPSGALVTLDSATLVTPPKGLEYGYVPIVTSQRPAKSEKAQTFMYDATANKSTAHGFLANAATDNSNIDSAARNKTKANTLTQ